MEGSNRNLRHKNVDVNVSRPCTTDVFDVYFSYEWFSKVLLSGSAADKQQSSRCEMKFEERYRAGKKVRAGRKEVGVGVQQEERKDGI